MVLDESVIIIVVLVIAIILLYKQPIQESWKNYRMKPYGEGRTGANPLTYYNLPKYRKPYRWPVCHNIEYPFPHCEPLD